MLSLLAWEKGRRGLRPKKSKPLKEREKTNWIDNGK